LYIKEVDLKNFKSFGKMVRVPLRNDFITVTGPNGSGKSNIVDALLFALCLSNSRAMRAERLPDLIYRGDNGKNPDFAEVTVRLDNSERSFPLDQDIIEVSRKIKVKDDKYASSYYFNGKSCSQGDLQDKLTKAGITPEGYNIVMQGDVTRIIEMTPVERRKIVDEIAGVSEFDEKKKKALEELDVVRERIARVDVILEEVGAQIARLKEERDRALSYRAHRDELRRQEAFLLLARFKESSADLSGLEAEQHGLKAKNEQLMEKSQSGRAELASLEERLKTLSSEINHKGEDEQIQVKRRIEELKGEIARETGRGEMAERASSEAEEQQRSCFMQADRLLQEQEELLEKSRDASLRGASLRGEMDDQTATLNAAKERIAKADAAFSQLRDELSTARQLREEAKARLGDLVRERDRLLDFARRGGLEREDLAREIKEASDALATADHEAEQLKAELAALNNKALEMERDRDDLEGARLRSRREMAEVERELQKLQGEYARSEGRLRSAEDKSGYSRAVEAVRSAMKRQMLPGLFGTIAELGNVGSRYSAALEVAAGARLQSVVAETDGDAAYAIDYLKRSQIGRATFLPLNKLDGGSLPPKPNRRGVVDYALNLVEFDPKYFSAFWYVFRDTLVVETLTDARELMGRYRMVTLDGDLVEKSGAMTGGHYRSRMKFAAEEGGKLVELSEKISSAERARSQQMEKLDQIDEEISRLSRDVEELNKAISKKTFRLDELSSARPRIEKSILERRERLVQMEGESLTHKERLDSLEGEILSVEASLKEQQQKISQVEASLEGSEIPELTRQADAAEAEIKRLQERIAQIDAEILKGRIREESNAERLSELQVRRDSLDAQKNESLERKRSAAAKISELESQLQSRKTREAEIEVELHGLKGARGELLDQVLVLQRSVDQAERERDRIEARLTATTAAAEGVRTSVQGLRTEIEACGVDCNEEPPKSDIVAQKMKSLDQAMRALEPVNMLAIDEYDHVKTRHDILQDRRETLARERASIVDKLDRYDQLKRESFLSSFHEINKNFKEIFRELSKGEGELILENAEDPLAGGMTIKARPAGKPFHRLEAMSGGEKSLTALSFIFAIQMFRPAPFYAMDEIDMFLDGVNVERVAKLIKKIAAQAQFIVVSLRKPMVQQSTYTIGVTMQENNISSVTGIATG
jgi:chromosome segregation protein